MLNPILDITFKKEIFLKSTNAEPAPPLGTILGNLGVNTIKFCEEFNLFTKSLPIYFLVKVIIYVFENRSFNFKVLCPSTGFFLNLLKFERTIRIRLFNKYDEKVINCITLKNIIQLALYKFPQINLYKSIFLI